MYQEIEIYEKYGHEIKQDDHQEKVIKTIETIVLSFLLVSLIIPVSIGLFVEIEFSVFHSWLIFMLLMIGPIALFGFIVYVLVKAVDTKHPQ